MLPLRVLLLAALASIHGLAAAQGPTVTLTPSNYNGYHISCFGVKDGSIDATVTGGTAPYTYSWTNAATTQDLEELPSGYYKLTVMDADSLFTSADITLVEPTELKLEAEPFTYPNDYHVSCFECFNGSIEVTATHGVPPYGFDWGDGTTTEDRAGLGAAQYKVTVTDANGCKEKVTGIKLVQPEPKDWTMEGNAGTDASENFFGTTDEQDVVFKSNSEEVLRLKSNGDISLLGNFLGEGPLFRMEDGTLRGGGTLVEYPELPPERCRTLASFPYWETRGNAFAQLCPDQDPVLGTLNNMPLKIVTNGTEKIHVAVSGRVGIGTVPPVGTVDGYRLFVEDGIATRDVLVKLGDWPDYVFQEGYHLLELGELKNYLKENHHLPGIPSAAEVEAKGGVEVGDLQKRMLETIEQQALYILHLEEKYQQLEQRLQTLEADKR